MFLRAHEVAKAAGISKNTLLRWLTGGKVPEVARDRNGWRVFSEDDLARVVAYANRITPAPFARAPEGKAPRPPSEGLRAVSRNEEVA